MGLEFVLAFHTATPINFPKLDMGLDPLQMRVLGDGLRVVDMCD